MHLLVFHSPNTAFVCSKDEAYCFLICEAKHWQPPPYLYITRSSLSLSSPIFYPKNGGNMTPEALYTHYRTTQCHDSEDEFIQCSKTPKSNSYLHTQATSCKSYHNSQLQELS
jgi:hypothetical protein